MIARGMVFCGSFTSSPAVDTASRPMSDKKIRLAAVVMPSMPLSQKPWKWSALNAVSAMMMNIDSTPSLISTMTVITAAASLAPRISSSMHIATSKAAGRLTMPGVASHGADVSDCGSCHPNRLSSNLFRYPLHPTATAEMDTPYSRSRQAATPIATNSPIVVYAYEYVEPDTGTEDAISA